MYEALSQFFDDGFQGFRAVADAVLFLRLDLGGSAAVFRQVKERIVAEAVFASLVVCDFAVEVVLGRDDLAAGKREHDRAGVVGAAVETLQKSAHARSRMRAMISVCSHSV